MSKQMTNNEYAKTPVFQKACELGHVKATTRQASKYRMKKGTAIKFSREAVIECSIV